MASIQAEFSKVPLGWEKNKDLDKCLWRMGTFIEETSRMICETVMGFTIIFRQASNMMASGEIIRKMAMGCLSMHMDKNTKDNGLKTKRRVGDVLYMRMVQYMKGTF